MVVESSGSFVYNLMKSPLVPLIDFHVRTPVDRFQIYVWFFRWEILRILRWL